MREDLSRSDIADRLYAVALGAGLVAEYGEDAIQGILADAFAVTESNFETTDEETRGDAIPPEFSDEELTLRFVQQHRGSIRYIAAWTKWYVWDGTRWIPDETLQVLHLVRRHCRVIASKCDRERIATAVASRKTITAVVSLARADRRIAANVDQWDCDPWLLNTPTGVVDLRSGKSRPHNPNDYITKTTVEVPDLACPIPLWQAFLERACRADGEFIAFLRRVLGYCLTGITREHALFFCYGTGANGKSTFINAVTGCVGDYHRAAAIETFTASANDRHPTDLAALRGARLVTAVETEEGRRWAESKIKSLTGGDKISARFMRQDFFEYLPKFKLIIAGNHKPGLRSVDEAIRRRFNLLPFVAAISLEERDEQLGEKLKVEWPGILAWMIVGCLEWQQQGLAPPEIVKIATAEYLEAEDSFAAWLEQACALDHDAFERTIDLFESWRKFAQSSGEYAGTLRKFSQRLEERGEAISVRKGRTQDHRGFFGLRLLTPGGSTAADDVVPL
jgi:putative DNA primase/helicase